MKNLKLKSFFLALLLTCGVGQMWGTLSFNGANNGVKFSKSFDNGANYYDHEIKHGTTNSTHDVGIVTNLYLKEYFVQLYQDEDNYTGGTHVYYWFYKTSSGNPGGAATSYSGNWGNWNDPWVDGKRYPQFGNNNISDDGGSTNVNLLYGQGPGEYTFEYYFTADCMNGWAPVYCRNNSSNFKATFTVPGFTTTSISQTFDNTTVGSNSSKTISFQHYGTSLTTSNCALSGTNSSEFEVTSIDETSVTVKFKPSSAGNKSATLTITDAHSKICTITLTGKTQFTVSYNKGSNGTGTNTTANKVYGSNLTLLGATFTRTGYTQTAWNTNSAGTGGTSYALSGNYTSEGAVTLYPTWTAKTYTATNNISKNGGDTDGTYTATYDATFIVIDVEPTNAGYEVEGYYRYAEGNNQIAHADGTLVSGLDGVVSSGKWVYDVDDLVIYPKWVPKSYTITLDANRDGISGTDGSTSFTVTSGDNNFDFDPSTGDEDEMTPPTKEGFTFAGYYDDPDEGEGTKVINADGSKPTTSYVNASGNWINSTDNLTLYAHWTDNGTYVFKGGASGNATSWSTAANWTKGVAPSENDGSEDIIILAPVEIPASATTNVNSVRIGSAGSYTLADGTTTIDAAGKLTIPATAMLKVTTNVQNYNCSTSEATPTTESTLHIKSASTGNGALVWGTSGTPGRAQVDFYTKSSAAGTWHGAETDVNQYIGTPFSDANVLYNYYNAWTFKVNDAGTAWERLKGNETMSPFVGYNVIYDGAAGHVFEMDGTLVTNANQTLSAPNATESVLANSWVAPIKIKAFEEEDFDGPNAAIYIFNSTSEDDSEGDKVGDGNYTVFSPYTSAGATDVIPSMQSFSVTGGTGTVKLNYDRLVKNPTGLTNGPMHAPRRYNADDAEPTEELEPKMESLWLHVGDANGWADLLKIYIREDFVEEFENGFDARKMYGDPAAPTLYGISPDGRMAINCIPTADNHVLGFHAGSASNEYTFRFTYDGEDELYLLDNKTGIETPISAEDTYTFTSESGDSDLRFSIIRKVPATPTDLEELTGETRQDSGVQKIMYNGKLYIIRGGRIYDATGAVVK